MKWYEHSLNPEAIKNLFPELPDLDSLDLLELRLQSNGVDCELRANLPKFPIKPPEKWLKSDFNQAQLKIQFIGLTKFEVAGWHPVSNQVNIQVIKNDEDVGVALVGETTTINIVCSFIRMEGLTAYRKST